MLIEKDIDFIKNIISVYHNPVRTYHSKLDMTTYTCPLCGAWGLEFEEWEHSQDCDGIYAMNRLKEIE